MGPLRKQLFCVSFLLAFCAGLMYGQSTTGTIVGSVTDPSGAVVPGVVITVTDLGTNITAKATTDGHGDYVVTPLAIGTYSVSFEAKGFKKYVDSGVKVDVQDRVRVDASLQIGKLPIRLKCKRRLRCLKPTHPAWDKLSIVNALWICR